MEVMEPQPLCILEKDWFSYKDETRDCVELLKYFTAARN